MKLSRAWPRQPFIGLAVAASAGILVADSFPSQTPAVAVALAICAVVALISRSSLAVCLVVA
ncbi:MAG: hypothetical protein LC642_06735, partial [Verrucomicrobiaceae bacterium]|nr:hypothetical protein [Verrucomicrobiaceae bacterium]